MKRIIAFFALILFLLQARDIFAGEDLAKKWTDFVKFKGSIWGYLVNQDHNYFTDKSSHFLDSIARVGAVITPNEKISGDIQIAAESETGDAIDLTGVSETHLHVDLELANVTLNDIFNKPLSVTVGRQNLEYGDGFLVYDGVSDRECVWLTPIRRFTAIKGVYMLESIQFDAFASIVDKDYKSYETFLGDFTVHKGNRNFFGFNAHIEKSAILDLGVFYRDDHSELKSNTIALSQRLLKTFDFGSESNIVPDLTLEGEIVEEFGNTKVKDYFIIDEKHDRQSFGGHIDTIFSFKNICLFPYAKLSYIYLPGDNPVTSKNEAFDPLYYGFKDWGKWYIGSINSYNLFNYNQRTLSACFGAYPTDKTHIRLFYYYTRLDRELTADAGTAWTSEFNLVFDWYPKEWFFCGAEIGWAHPLDAAVAYADSDNNTTEVVVWAGVQF